MFLIEITDLLRKTILTVPESVAMEMQKINWADLSENEKIGVLREGKIRLQEQVKYARYCTVIAEFYSIG